MDYNMFGSFQLARGAPTQLALLANERRRLVRLGSWSLHASVGRMLSTSTDASLPENADYQDVAYLTSRRFKNRCGKVSCQAQWDAREKAYAIFWDTSRTPQ
eukprot:3247078-Pyramimonas_sp.AAC.1